MRKYKKRYLENAISTNTTSLAMTHYINRCLFKEALVHFSLTIVVLLYSLIFHNKISKLAIITADTIFSHEVVFKPDWYYFAILIVLAFISLAVAIHHSPFRQVVLDKTKAMLRFYKIYDLISFILGILVAINFIIIFIVTPVTINGSSMNNTFASGDKVFIWHLAYKPDNEDVIILDAKNYNQNQDEVFYIKRIMAKPGDTLKLVGKQGAYYLYRNDEIITKNIDMAGWHIITNQSDELIYVIPSGKYLLLGDNQSPYGSIDSRSFGLVDEMDIIGKVVLRYYPFSSFGIPEKNIKS